jgi:hypothetical protein
MCKEASEPTFFLHKLNIKLKKERKQKKIGKLCFCPMIPCTGKEKDVTSLEGSHSSIFFLLTSHTDPLKSSGYCTYRQV